VKIFLKATGSEILAFSVAVSSDLYPGPHSYHNRIHVQFLTCYVHLVVMGSECGWGLGVGAKFQKGQPNPLQN